MPIIIRDGGFGGSELPPSEVLDAVAANVLLIRGTLEHADYGNADLNADIAEVLAAVNAIDLSALAGVPDSVGTANTNISAILAELANATYGLAALKTKLNSVGTDVTTANSSLSDATSGLAALKVLLDSLLAELASATYGLENIHTHVAANQTNIANLDSYLTHTSYGLAALLEAMKDTIKAAYRGSFSWVPNLILNPNLTFDLDDWTLINTSGTAGMALSADQARTFDNSMRLIGTNLDQVKFYCGHMRKPGNAYWFSCWVYATEIIPVIAALDNDVASLTANTVANAWTNITGTFTADSATDKELAFTFGFNSATGAKTIYLDDFQLIPLQDNMYDRLVNKDTSHTYSPSTDSLEAISDAIAAIATKQDAAVVRSAQSGSLLMTGSEQTLFEATPGAPFKLEQAFIDLTQLADTRSITIKAYVKVKSGGTYRLLSAGEVFTGTAGAVMVVTPAVLPIGTTGYQVVIPSAWSAFGFKVTAQQTVAGAGYLTIDHEWFVRGVA